MKKTLLALAIASISASAFAVDTSSQNSKNDAMFAFDPMHKDQFSVSGSVGVGGYYDTGSKAFYDDWATGLTLAVNYRNNRIVGYFETDLMLQYTTDNKTSPILKNGSEFATNVDKAWLGFDTGVGIASFAWANDTALDAVDGAGDNTYEFGASAGNASDAFNVVKFQGSTSGFAYGVSYFETEAVHTAADKGVNGYVGIEQEMFNVYAGYETRNEADYDVATVTGNVKLGAVKLGANFWIENGDSDDLTGTNAFDKKNTGYYLSAGYALSEDLTLAAGYAANTVEKKNLQDLDQSYMNVAAMYTMAKNIDMGIDIKQELDMGEGNDEETHVFAAAYYYF
ncbi:MULTISPECIES: porin [Aliivibrio]|uniref:Porin n=1 Tax=Aliivibrio finisterrensis TaxID=511998 RepID=A0A4Q5KXD3_9GAMM|nr:MULTISPECIES: porin [Aliivibrio]MDD9179281.1 porin [Aliivibrio sp. A6]RYU51117.1 porin [Aliivibrio finisterrensis]RYU55531.1 porin [Aliivibrio finisterrensis]RYU60371.1 porin [Aliivibrio finisterrensis]RYU64158.1 porin [Aliivibrio finisterrensis]